MANLLYSAKTADGKPREGFVEAASAREAREKLAAAGLTGIVLHQEIGIAQQSTATVAGLDPADLTRLAQFQLRLRAAPGLATVLKEVARRSALWLVVDAALLAYGLATRRMPLAVVAA